MNAISEPDLALLSRHLVHSEPQPGFIMDFVGTRTSINYVDLTAGMSGACYNQIPVPGDWKASALEWIGALKAVEASQGQFIAVELGAGWGPWVVATAHVARRLGRTPIRLYPVEADSGKYGFLLDHMANNGVRLEEHRAERAIVGPFDGTAHYPIIDSVVDWGSPAQFGAVSDPSKFVSMRSVTVATLLKDEPLVDLVHCDIQGAELEVMTRSIDALNSKVRYMVIGTHSRQVETGLVDLLVSANWRLENEEPAKLDIREEGPILLGDGTQVWRNTAL